MQLYSGMVVPLITSAAAAADNKSLLYNATSVSLSYYSVALQ